MVPTSKVDRLENEVLLLCARTAATETIVQRLRSLATPSIDWDYLFKLARRHSVVPLVYTQLREHASDLVPSKHLIRFKENYQENVARNLVLTAELVRVLTSLSGAGVEAVPFKGPVLALFAYDHLALRRFVDLDIIVRKEDVFKAKDVLLDLGYAVSGALSSDQEALLLRTQHSVQFELEGRRILTELHTEVASHLFASSVSANDLWSQLITLRLNDREVRSLSAEDLLFSLSVHGSRHLWERLSWICDIAELISRHDVDWTSLMSRAARTDCERMFYLGPFVAQALLETDLPREVRSKLENDSRLKSLAREIRERLFNGPEHIPATPRQIFRYNVELRKSWRARARYLVHALRPTDGDVG
ncbi:MAG TPA: nucleotidyltransferase family protein, partial [Pyrinomonadaceae bacterium]